MKIIIAGGTGFIGSHLARRLIKAHHEVTVLSRNPAKAQKRLPGSVIVAKWSGSNGEGLEKALQGKDALINLSGESIADARWTEPRKQLLRSSRIDTTRSLVDALNRTAQPPSILVNASAIGFYQTGQAHPMKEISPCGNGFLADLCVAWEKEARRAETFGVRVVLPRIGMVLGKTGGALPKMLLPFRLFLGGPILPGTQKVSWIHLEDLSALIEWTLKKPEISGPVNAVSPECVTMEEFCQTLGHALHRPSWFPVPGFVLKLALGEMATLMTTGQEVKPVVAEQNGFHFSYPQLDLALQSLFRDS